MTAKNAEAKKDSMSPLRKAYYILRYLGPRILWLRVRVYLDKYLGLTQKRFAPQPWNEIDLSSISLASVPIAVGHNLHARFVCETLVAGKGVAVQEDTMATVLGFEDGSVGTVNYFANGPKGYPKETLEVFSNGRVLQMNNFRKTVGFGFPEFKKFRTGRQDKGHLAECRTFVERIGVGGDQLMPLSQLVNVTLASFAAAESAATNETIAL